MPASTPAFGIQYPCENENIDCTSFETFTESIQDALDSVRAIQAQALRRPQARVDSNDGLQLVAAGAQTNITYSLESFDTDNMVNLAVNNDRITIVTAGAYLVTGWLEFGGPWTTLAAQNVYLTQNGTTRFRKKDTVSGVQGLSLQVIGTMNCAAGDIIRMAGMWTGTGGPSNIFSGVLTAQLVSLA